MLLQSSFLLCLVSYVIVYEAVRLQGQTKSPTHVVVQHGHSRPQTMHRSGPTMGHATLTSPSTHLISGTPPQRVGANVASAHPGTPVRQYHGQQHHGLHSGTPRPNVVANVVHSIEKTPFPQHNGNHSRLVSPLRHPIMATSSMQNGGAHVAQMTVATSLPQRQSDIRHIFQIPDLHGDFNQFSTLLWKLGLTDQSATTWTGGRAIVVFTGDYVDRGIDSANILVHLRSLLAQAKLQGGEIIALRGNHEQMLLDGDFRYVQLEDAKGYLKSANIQFKKNKMIVKNYGSQCFADLSPSETLKTALQEALREGGLAGFIETMPLFKILDVGANKKVVFLHAGFEWSALKGTKCLDKADQTDADRDRCLNDLRKYERKHNPLWSRKVARGEETEADLDKTLAALGVAQMIVAHTSLNPQNRKDNGLRYHGKVVLTDRLLSRAFDHGDCNSYYGRRHHALSSLYFSPEGDVWRLTEKASPSASSVNRKAQSSDGKIKAEDVVSNASLPEFLKGSALHAYFDFEKLETENPGYDEKRSIFNPWTFAKLREDISKDVAQAKESYTRLVTTLQGLCTRAECEEHEEDEEDEGDEDEDEDEDDEEED